MIGFLTSICNTRNAQVTLGVSAFVPAVHDEPGTRPLLEVEMNGKSEEALIERILLQLEEAAEHQKHENDALLECLLGCVSELSKLRRKGENQRCELDTAEAMGEAETKARLEIARHIKGVTEEQLDNFRSGRADLANVHFGTNRDHFDNKATRSRRS